MEDTTVLIDIFEPSDGINSENRNSAPNKVCRNKEIVQNTILILNADDNTKGTVINKNEEKNNINEYDADDANTKPILVIKNIMNKIQKSPNRQSNVKELISEVHDYQVGYPSGGGMSGGLSGSSVTPGGVARQGGSGGRGGLFSNNPKNYFMTSTGGSGFDYDPDSRNDFVWKVCSIVFVMFALTSVFIILSITIPGLRQFFQIFGVIVIIPAGILTISLSYAMFCSQCTRQPPANYICLGLTVVGYSIIAAVITVHYSTHIIFYSFLTTAAVVLVCTLLACSRFDFTSWLLYVVALTVIVCVLALCVSLGSMITGNMMKPVRIAILAVMTILQSVMLIIELQMILGGRGIELNEDDYALGAFMLYTSIMDIFLKIVQLFGSSE